MDISKLLIRFTSTIHFFRDGENTTFFPYNNSGMRKIDFKSPDKPAYSADRYPDSVMLRATWMYDMPIYGIPNRSNFLMDMLLKKELSFSSSQHWAVTYVREAVGNMEKLLFFPVEHTTMEVRMIFLCLRLLSG